jgi:shikimate kinase
MGSGKSAVGRLIAERAGAPFHDLDSVIERTVKRTISEMWDAEGEHEFRRLESRLLPEVLAPGAVAALGGGAPLADANWRLIKERAVSVFLDAPFDLIWQRVGGAVDRPLIRGRRPEEVAALLEQRRPLYSRATFTVDAGRLPSVIANEVFELWSK